jgi:hypothetical protein
MKKLAMVCATAMGLAMWGKATVAATPETPVSLLAMVNTSDGVSHVEAERIAKAYFLLHVGCGNFSEISAGQDAWIVEGRFGRGARPIHGFLIDRRSGAITSPIGPSFKAPQDMLRAKTGI